MKKTRINLIINRADYQKYENYFSYLRMFLIGLTLVFFCLFLFFFIIIKNKSDIETSLQIKKSSLLQFLKQKTEDTAKVNYIEKKYQDLKTFVKDDAFSSPYYSLLNSALLESSESATLKSFTINKNREVTFTITFSDFNKLRNFFKFIESPIFLEKFETISLKSLTLFGATEIQKENYELSFTGKFIELKGLTN